VRFDEAANALVVEQAADEGHGDRPRRLGQGREPVGFDAGAGNDEDPVGSDAEALRYLAVVGILHQHRRARMADHVAQERAQDRPHQPRLQRGRGEGEAEPAIALSRSQRSPAAASEPTTVGCKAT